VAAAVDAYLRASASASGSPGATGSQWLRNARHEALR
jgi:hypothetical protein